MASAKKKATAAKTPAFVEKALRIEGKVAEAARKALSKGREAVVAAIATEVHPENLPAWIVLPTEDLEEVVRLAPPMFRAQGQDDDAFYGGLQLGKLVYRGGGKADQHPKKDGDATTVKVGAADLAKIDAYDPEGALPIDGIRWIEKIPKTLAEVEKLLRAARHAVAGEMDAYDHKDYAPHDPVADAAAIRAALAPAAPGSGAMHMNGATRTGFFDTDAPRKEPKVAWRTEDGSDLAGGEWGGSVLVADGRAFGAHDSFTCSVGAADVKTGKILWKQKTATSQCWPQTHMAVDRGVLYFGTNHGLYAFDAATGKQRWLAKLSRLTGAPLVLGDVVIVGAKKGLFAISIASGRKAWTRAAKKDGVQGSIAFVNETMFVRIDDELLALDPAGKGKTVRWKAKAEGYGQAGPALDGGLVFYSETNDLLVAADAATGKKKWSCSFAEEKYGGLGRHGVTVGGGSLLTVDYTGAIHALDAASGKRRWVYDFKGDCYSIGSWTPVIARDTVISAMPHKDGSRVAVIALDLDSGKELWRIEKFDSDPSYAEKISWYCTPVMHEATVYVQTHKGILALR